MPGPSWAIAARSLAQSACAERGSLLPMIRFCCAALCLILNGCDVNSPWSLSAGISDDLRALLASAGVALGEVECNSIGRTRDAVCRFRLARREFGDVAERLKLRQALDKPGQRLRRFLVGLGPDACEALIGGDVLSEVYYAAGRPPTLRLEHRDGAGAYVQFEYMLLHRDAGTGQCCAQFSYAYG